MKIILLSFLLTCPAVCLAADTPKKAEPPRAFTDPANVEDDDFAIQGEYVGEFDGKRFGVQIWARGGGKFEAVSHAGGLPGEGWDGDRSTITRVNGERSGGEKAARFENDHMRATVEGGSILVTSLQGERVMEMNRVLRQSPSLGAKPPAGAVVLFSGKDHNHFPGSKVTDDGLLEQGATSAEKFADGALHVEFMLSYMPEARGQGRSNSGVYLQGRYEVQVLDSFALEGKNNECGGIYTIAAPAANLCLPPLTWQTYDIDFTAAKYDPAGNKTANARMTVKHNGVTIHENVGVPHITNAAPLKEENSPGPVYLQDHHNPVRYRNVWFLPR